MKYKIGWLFCIGILISLIWMLIEDAPFMFNWTAKFSEWEKWQATWPGFLSFFMCYTGMIICKKK